MADGHLEGLMYILVHLVNKEEHGDIDFLHIAVGEVGQPIEKVGVLSLEMNGYDISLIFNALGDKGLFLLHIFNLLSSAS